MFTSLSARLASLPDVILGPMLRLVLADQVNVVFATKTETKITVRVYDEDDTTTAVLIGTKNTIPIADNLHVVCVTAKGGTLVPGAVYVYNAAFGPKGDESVPVDEDDRNLFTNGVVHAQGSEAESMLTYSEHGGPSFPSFVFPPADPTNLRILHGSCRKPHGEGGDALPIANTILASSFINPNVVRPHQLFLTGDQIYADDVAIQMLFLLQDAADALGFPKEQLPTNAGTKTGAQFRPNARAEVMKEDAQFTSGDADSHLMTFAEYALMYVFAWSDGLWPGETDLPRFADMFMQEYQDYKTDRANLNTTDNEDTEEVKQVRNQKLIDRMAAESPNVRNYCQGVPLVRRLLANIPTLTIFDDHEITDDWNLNLSWMERVAGSSLGSAVIRNGLVAYALFQAWGNTPTQFTVADAPGTKLLANVAAWDGLAGTDADALATWVGLPTSFDAHAAVKPDGSLAWHYSHRWAGYQLLVLDTRTERGAVVKGGDPPALIYAPESFDKMVPRVPAPAANDLVIAIAPGPVFGVPFHEAVASVFSFTPAVDPEHWALSPFARERLLAALLSRPAAGGDAIIHSRVILLGGDVHHASAVHVRYHATSAFLSNVPARVEGAIAQLTSSAFKNQTDLTLFVEKVAFTMFDHDDRVVQAPQMPLVEVSGWNNAAGSRMVVGQRTLSGPQGISTASIAVKGSPALFECVYGVAFSAQSPASAGAPTYSLSAAPDWKYEIRPQRGDMRGRGVASAIVGAPGAAGKLNRIGGAATAQAFNSANGGVGGTVVGHNNLGDITFSWGPGDAKKVIQDLWWQLDGASSTSLLTHYEIALPNGQV